MTDLLNKINSPADLKQLSKEELPLLAAEIRKFMIENVSKTGGHLAPNLGVVELSLALHYVFNSPQDKLVWDVGHQSYIHKIITGRRDVFHTLRQHKGICGFPKPEESEYDAFGTGHSSTSISAALGMAIARDVRGEDYNVVGIIGDGALTGGMAFEALNNAGDLHKKLIVVLNDNEMSIAKNVGAMSEYLERMRSEPTYSRIKRDVEVLIKSIPSVGEQVLRTAERVKNSLKYMLVPGMLFEEFGFRYIGPIDGHNLDSVISMLEYAKNTTGPVLVHVITQKGLGYEPAEKNPDKFHGISAFDIETGAKIPSGPAGVKTYTEVFSSTMLELAAKDERIVAISAAMPDGTGLTAFANRYPDRFFDVGIAEQHAATMAAGMAINGLRPVLALYSTFAQRAYDQISHDICLQNLPVILALDRAGLVGDDGATHHGVFDLSYLSHLPNMVIMAPRHEGELRNMLFTAFDLNCPVAIRYPRGAGLGVPTDAQLQLLPLGKAEVLTTGEKAMLVGVGNMVDVAERTAEKLNREGLGVGVINARFVKPFDKELFIDLAKKGVKMVFLEENVKAGGFASNVLMALLDAGCLHDKNIMSIGIGDEFVTHGSKDLLHKELGFDVPSLVSKIRIFINEK